MKIDLTLDRGGPGRLLIDDVDISGHVLADSVQVGTVPDAPTLTITLMPRNLTITGDMQVILQRIEEQTDQEPTMPG